MKRSQRLPTALWYASHGWPVIPLHSISDGVCTCGKPECDSPAKHPRTANGLKDATTDANTINRWWQQWPDANIGIRTGIEAGVIVVDVDPRHGGDESLAELVAKHGELPPTVEAITGSGGRHLVFAHPGGTIRNRSNVRPGIDIRADGGYIVAPPSDHVSGGRYAWRAGHAPQEIRLAPLPTWLSGMLSTPERQADRPADRNGDELRALLGSATRYVARTSPASEGNRNNAAFSLAGNLTSFEVEGSGLRLTEAQVLDLVRLWNHRNDSPLSDHELGRVVNSALTNGTPRPAHIVRANRSDNLTNDKTPRSRRKPTVSPVSEPARVEAFRPFPVDALPSVLARFIRETAAALGCDPTYVALPTLCAAAAAIGTTRVIELKASWCEPAIVWTGLVARSGTLKSPAFDAATAPLRRAQTDALRAYGAERDAHERAALEYERQLAAWRKSRTGGEPPDKPKSPAAQRFIVADATVEAVAPILEVNPRGVLLARDELAGWIRGFDAYKAKGRGGDVAAWLELWRAGPLIVDRKTGERRTIFVPRAAVSVCGTIQPGVLAATLTTEHFESGLAARLLLAQPPEREKRWSERTPPRAIVAAFADLTRELLALQHSETEHGPEPLRLRLAPGARPTWAAWYDRHARRIVDADTDSEAAVLAKVEAYGARFALIFALADDPRTGTVSTAALERGIVLANWFAGEARRVYGLLAESDEDCDRRRLVELIRRKGERITARELRQCCRQFRHSSDAAEQALNELAGAGFGTWEQPAPGPKGGRPTRIFLLSTPSTDYETPVTDRKGLGFVDVDTVDVAAGADKGGCPVGEDMPLEVYAGLPEVAGTVPGDYDEWGEL